VARGQWICPIFVPREAPYASSIESAPAIGAEFFGVNAPFSQAISHGCLVVANASWLVVVKLVRYMSQLWLEYPLPINVRHLIYLANNKRVRMRL
jgi:hypothetical protein